MHFNERQQALLDDAVRAYSAYGDAWCHQLIAACARLSMTYDPTQRTLLVSGLASDGWFLFVNQPELRPDRVADTVWYSESVTGLPPVDVWEATAAWIVAQVGFTNVLDVEHAQHSPTNRVTPVMARFLAMRNRVQEWGGFAGEADELRQLEAALTPADRALVAERLAGQVVCGSARSQDLTAP